jgi:hypothetical protein
VLEWLARYPHLSADPTDPPSVTEAVAVTGGVNAEIVEALEMVRRRGGSVRAWVIGDADLDVDAPVQHVGTDWPL